MENNPKYHEYSMKLSQALIQVWDEENDFYIDEDELQDVENMRHFIHALCTVTPHFVLNHMIEEAKDWADVNALATKLLIIFHSEAILQEHIDQSNKG
jgi:hypothetical protein